MHSVVLGSLGIISVRCLKADIDYIVRFLAKDGMTIELNEAKLKECDCG